MEIAGVDPLRTNGLDVRAQRVVEGVFLSIGTEAGWRVDEEVLVICGGAAHDRGKVGRGRGGGYVGTTRSMTGRGRQVDEVT
jgi:hypothetical protein